MVQKSLKYQLKLYYFSDRLRIQKDTERYTFSSFSLTVILNTLLYSISDSRTLSLINKDKKITTKIYLLFGTLERIKTNKNKKTETET